jgi:hypothetical protein
MKKFYCIRFEEGYANEPCPECCKTCEGWVAKSDMPDSKPVKHEPDVTTTKLH